MYPIVLAGLLVCLPALDGKGLPLQVPAGWSSRVEQGQRLLTPNGVPEGKLYTVLVPTMTRKVGTLRGVLESAKAALGEVATFTPGNEPARSRTDGGWEYEVVIGTLTSGDRTLMGQAMGLKKGDDEGVILVIADSVATMERYVDAFTAMVKAIGAPAAAPAARVDLKYRPPAGWAVRDQGTTVHLEKWEQKGTTEGYERQFQLLVLPSRPLAGSLRQSFQATWAAEIVPVIETSIAPLPMVRRLASGRALAYDVDAGAKNKAGVGLVVACYLVADGSRVVPIVGFFSGTSDGLEKDLLALFESAEIPDAGDAKPVLVDPAEVAGAWARSDCALANYVTASGGYAGDASIALDEKFTLSADGTFSFTFVAARSSGPPVIVSDAGAWQVADDVLVLAGKDQRRYRIFGVGADPKVGRFLVISISSGTEERLDLASPRRAYSGTWYRRKG